MVDSATFLPYQSKPCFWTLRALEAGNRAWLLEIYESGGQSRTSLQTGRRIVLMIVLVECFEVLVVYFELDSKRRRCGSND